METPEDFNQPTAERVFLLEQLQARLGSASPVLWAVCHICDIDRLKRLLNYDTGVLFSINTDAGFMVRYWGSTPPPSLFSTPQRNLSPLNPSMQSPAAKRQKMHSPTALPRDENIRKRVGERDNSRCVLTGVAFADVAHIYPYHSIKRKEPGPHSSRHKFWSSLRLYWSPEKVDSWKTKLFPNGLGEPGCGEQAYNMISLAPTVHAIWRQGLFALKPVSESADKKKLKVQFVWQQRQTELFPINLTTVPVSTQGLEQTAGVWLHHENGKRITSGDFFELTTDNPFLKPLPSFEILELQWFLHRIQGMAGAGEEEQESWLDTDPDSDMDVPELDISGEPSPPELVVSSPASLVLSNESTLAEARKQGAEEAGVGEGVLPVIH